jgi:hypothetical protein
MSQESNSHSFVVKIWPEENHPNRPARARFRGHIAHAYTKDRSSIKEPAEILEFIQPYVEAMGVKICLRTRLMLALAALGRRKQRARPTTTTETGSVPSED